MSEPNRVFDAAVAEVLDRAEILDALPTFTADEIAPLLEQIVEATLGDPAAFDAAIAELKVLHAATLLEQLPDWLRREDANVQRRFDALRDLTEDEVRATPAIQSEDVARRRAERLMGE